MKINKWTLGLAALGLVSLASVAQAEEKTAMMTALSATTVSGYVDTSMVWNPGTGNANPAPFAFNGGKQDGFNINAVDLKISKPLDEGQWSAGYTLELMAGPDAGGVNGYAGDGGSADIRQAFVNLRMPVGNGLDWQIGRFDNIIGYESSDSYKNPNWTRSYGYTLEPTEHTGVLMSYKFCDVVSASAGVVNTVTTGALNARSGRGETQKGIISLISVTAPESWGAIAGSGFYAGFDHGYGSGGAIGGKDRDHIYLGASIKTPVKGLSVGASYDSINNCDVGGANTGYAKAFAVYTSFKPSDESKFSAHLRAEYARGNALAALGGTHFTVDTNSDGVPDSVPVANVSMHQVLAVTGTLQYDLWANVISRLEVRWDHIAGNGSTPGGQFGGGAPGAGTKKNDFMVAANVVYKF
jgi:hypothetical protein